VVDLRQSCTAKVATCQVDTIPLEEAIESCGPGLKFPNLLGLAGVWSPEPFDRSLGRNAIRRVRVRGLEICLEVVHLVVEDVC
jgi:hypothetical protein